MLWRWVTRNLACPQGQVTARVSLEAITTRETSIAISIDSFADQQDKGQTSMEQAGNWGREPVVFLPGMMCDARVFTPQLNALSAQTPVMVAPLHGGARVEDIALHILSMLPEKFALVGLSMGGIVALELLRRAPERITRLCLMATTPLSETPDQAAMREPLIISARTGGLEKALQLSLPPEVLAPGPRRLEILNLVREMGMRYSVGLISKPQPGAVGCLRLFYVVNMTA